MNLNKTNVMRLLDKEQIPYEIHLYPNEDEAVDGMKVAELIHKDCNFVFKTLITKAKNDVFVFMIPVHKNLDLKKAAKAANQKSLEMVSVAQILPLTGYVRGGCSPIGMKSKYPTFIDQSVLELPTFIFSAGKIGMQVETKIDDVQKLIKIQIASIACE